MSSNSSSCARTRTFRSRPRWPRPRPPCRRSTIGAADRSASAAGRFPWPSRTTRSSAPATAAARCWTPTAMPSASTSPAPARHQLRDSRRHRAADRYHLEGQTGTEAERKVAMNAHRTSQLVGQVANLPLCRQVGNLLHVALACVLLLAAAVADSIAADAPQRPNILWLIAEDFGPHLGCYGDEAGLDAEPRPPGRRGRAVHALLHHGPGLLAQPLGLHDRHVPDHASAPTTTARTATTATSCPTGVRVLTDWLRDAGYFTANVRDAAGRASASRAPARPTGTSPTKASRSTRNQLGRPEAAPAVLRPDQLPRDAPQVQRASSGPTRRRSRSRPTIPTIR